MAFVIVMWGCGVGDKMQNTPSALEFDGFYNVEPNENDKESQGSFLVVRPGVGLPTFDEINALTDGVLVAMRDSGVQPGQLYYDLGFQDRTAKVSFRNPTDLSMARLNALQSVLTSKFENWRIAVIGNSKETTIIIYPSAIVFPKDSDHLRQLKRIREDLARNYDDTEGAFQRQLQYVRHAIASERKDLGVFNGPPRIIAVFDNFRSDLTSLCIWVVDPGDGIRIPNWIPEDDFGDGFKGTAGASAEFDVTSTGELVEAYTAKDRYRGCTYALVYSKDRNRGSIFFVSPKDGARVEIPIAHLPVLSDRATLSP